MRPARALMAVGAALWALGATPATAVWKPPGGYVGASVDAVSGTAIGRAVYRPRNGAGTIGRFRMRAALSSCAPTDGTAASGDELICILGITGAIGTGFSTANVIAFTEVNAVGTLFVINHVSPVLVVPSGVVNITGGACYPWDGGTYATSLAADGTKTAGTGANGQTIAFDRNPLTPVPVTTPCIFF